MFTVFIQNVTLLVTAIVIYTMIIHRWAKGSIIYAIYSGILFSIVAILGMRMPFILEPGVIFDGRSIIHSIAGLLGGPFTALTAAVISAGYRIYLGGGGMVVGVFNVFQSSALGVLFYYLNRWNKVSLTPLSIIAFSLAVQLIMLYSFIYIPGLSLQTILTQLAFPILVIYPLTTLAIVYIINVQEERMNTELKLQENEKRLKKTQEIAKVGSWDLDHSTGDLTWSPEAYKIFGLSEQHFQPDYNSFLEAVHPEDRAAVDQAFKESLKEERERYEFEHRLIRQETGEIHYVLEKCEHIKNKNGIIVRSVGMIQDITERKLYEHKLKFMSLHDQLTGLYNRNFFEEELDRICRSRDYPVTVISADLDGLKIINDTLGHARGDQMLIKCAKILKDSLRDGDVLARIGGDEFAVIMPKTDTYAGEAICSRIRIKLSDFNSNGTDLPLSLSLGVATADSPEQGNLYDLVKKADDFMYRDKLYHRSSRRNQTVQALMAALSERDFISEGHADRVQELCYRMGVEVGLSSSQLSDLALLAQVHDLGKVGIPDYILFKPGELTFEEWEIMRMHPEKGYRIASASPDLSPVAELILKHHENWDGQGYPLGLKGEDIPVECRILSIVDAFDAMTNNRPYSKAKSESKALKELKRCSGSQFDPQLIQVFTYVLNKSELK
ncbi:MAG: diguanylate cyclase [Bacillota bacterium]|nr:diguanylate cyclase [Bacillota bacterium]